jgi:alanyl aminopeptidase
LALFIDARASVETGAIKLTALVNLLPLMIAERNRFAVSQAIDVLQDLRPHVPEAMRDRFDAWVVKLIGAQAKQIGWLPRATDDIDAENLRDDLVTLAAFSGEPTLRAEAIKLAGDWRKLPAAVRGNILMIAVRSDAATFNKVVAELPAEPSRRFRSEMIDALRAVTSLEQAAQAMKVVLNKAIDARETNLLLIFEETMALRDQAEAFFTANFDQLLKLLPSESTTGSAVDWVHIYTNVCRSEGRDAIAKNIQQRFGKMVGAERGIAQALEEMDQCAAARTMFATQLRLWLADTK